MPTMAGSAGEQAYKAFEEIVTHNFAKNARVGVTELMAWVAETPQIQEFFTFTEMVN